MSTQNYLLIGLTVICIGLFGWLYANTCSVSNTEKTITELVQKYDSIDTRVKQLEYYVENTPKELVLKIDLDQKQSKTTKIK
jgi:hypothetical protein